VYSSSILYFLSRLSSVVRLARKLVSSDHSIDFEFDFGNGNQVVFGTLAVGFRYKKQLLPIGSICDTNLSSLSQLEVGQIDIFLGVLYCNTIYTIW
jgi:hypothetical protein